MHITLPKTAPPNCARLVAGQQGLFVSFEFSASLFFVSYRCCKLQCKIPRQFVPDFLLVSGVFVSFLILFKFSTYVFFKIRMQWSSVKQNRLYILYGGRV